ncbi:MAG: NADP-dependent oxidoreductase [Thermoleophilia bacterium]|nr:NADP-dependent oxidoreductase [Thermoleophilia bacterium]
MSMPPSREIHLAARPQGAPQPTDFALVETEVPEPAEGQVLIRNAFVSVDPYMRGRMNDTKSAAWSRASYVPPFELGEVMTGAAVGQIVTSRNDGFEEGAWVVHHLGWRELALSNGKGLVLFDAASGSVSTSLGVLGMPGLTAYVGLLDVGRVEAGETVFVSGAAGAVGSAVGQIAKLKGCRVIGSAGSAAKVAWLREIGFDEAFDYHDVVAGEALSDGIDVYFDNVGGPMLEAALAALRVRGRVVACGAISQYNATEWPAGPGNLFLVVTKRLRMEGFIVSDHGGRLPAFLAEVGPWVRDGAVRYRETVVEGIEHAPAALIGLLAGENIGKMLVRVGPGNT